MTDNTLLHRQVNPSWVQHDVVSEQAFVTSQTFLPTPKDDNQLSVYNGDKFSSSQSFNHFTNIPNCNSVGVLSVTVAEVKSIDDMSAHDNDYPFDGHAYIDFSNVTSRGAIKKKAQKLRDFAISRGWTHKI